MKKDINVPLVLDAVKRAGTLFLTAYKQNAIASDKAQLFELLAGIDERCLAVLKADMAEAFPDTPWNICDEFDSDGQKKPLELPE